MGVISFIIIMWTIQEARVSCVSNFKKNQPSKSY
jgi:hypothetical protein